MADLPDPLREHALALLLEGRHAGWIEVRGDGVVGRCGGDLALFGLGDLDLGVDVLERVGFLVGLVPASVAVVRVLHVLTETDRFADVHVQRLGDRTLVLIVDSTSRAERFSTLQQWSNDLQLDDEAGSADAGTVRERVARTATITTAVFRVHVTPADTQSRHPGDALALREAALRCVDREVLAGGGLVHRRSVTESVALFGVLPTDGQTVRQAVETATRTVAAVRALPAAEAGGVALRADLSAGIASGVTVLGSSDRGGRSLPVAFGDPIDTALELAMAAAPGGIRTDDSIRSAWPELARREADGELPAALPRVDAPSPSRATERRSG